MSSQTNTNIEMNEHFSFLHSEKTIYEKASDAFIAFKKIVNSDEEKTEIDFKLIKMLDNKVKSYF